MNRSQKIDEDLIAYCIEASTSALNYMNAGRYGKAEDQLRSMIAVLKNENYEELSAQHNESSKRDL